MERCKHDLPKSWCALCVRSPFESIEAAAMSVQAEADAHQGHPSTIEERLARVTRPSLAAAVGQLSLHVDRPVAFFVDLCGMLDDCREERTWASRSGMTWTVTNMLRGGAAKMRSIGAIAETIAAVDELTRPSGPRGAA